jgi:hypothetical protein
MVEAHAKAKQSPHGKGVKERGRGQGATISFEGMTPKDLKISH